MKFRVERHTLADAVAWTVKGLPTHPSVPVLAGVLLTVTDGVLHLSGFDYEVSAQAEVAVNADGDGAALVSGRLLAQITKALPDKPVEITLVDAHLELVCGTARFTLPTMPVEDYPTLPDLPETTGTVDAHEFAAAVAQVAFAAGRDESLPMMTGIRLELNGPTLTLVATDRYRLALRELTWQPDNPDVSVNALVPARTLADTAKTLGGLGGEITLALGDLADNNGIIGFAWDTDTAPSRRTTSRLLDGTSYPPVRNLFPADAGTHARAATRDLVDVVRRVSLVADRTSPVWLAFSNDGLVVEAGGTEEARASEAMDAQFDGPQPARLAFNPQYLLEALAALNTPLALFDIKADDKPVMLTPGTVDGETVPGYRHLLQPVKVVR